MSSAMSLKARIRNIARQKNIPAQVVLQNYMFERFLVRLSLSIFRDKFVLKGGILVAALVGLDNRVTMDLDATLKNLPMTPDRIRTALEEICAISCEDDIVFAVGNITPIREDDVYGGYRIMLSARYDTIRVSLSVDVSTGDVITPRAVEYTFSEIFDDTRSFCLWTYNIETVLAEKVETILRRTVYNTRPRDYYDAYIIATTRKYDSEIFLEAIKATSAHRGTTDQISNTTEILRNISESSELIAMWNKYRKQFDYAKDISYDRIIEVLTSLLS